MPYCRCCELDDAPFGPQRSFNDLPMAAIVCGICSKHQRSLLVDVQKRERDHREMWIESKRYALEVLADNHADVVASLQATIDGLKEELEARPVRVVFENLDAEEVQAAHAAAQSAYRSRDYAYLQLTKIHMHHFEAQVGQCRCGVPIDECEVGAVVDGFRGLKAWERNQTERRRRDQHHMLPRDHPGIIDARWDFDEDEVAEFDAYPKWGAGA